MIDLPKRDETAKLVELAQATGFFNPDEIHVVREMLDEYFAEKAKGTVGSGDYIWVVYREAPRGLPLGFACYGPVSLSEDVYDLYWIAVHPGHQSKKLGTALLKYVEDALQEQHARQLYIETSDTAKYAPTRAFYEKRGYHEAAHFPDYYHVGDGKVVFVKVFNSEGRG